MERQKEYRRTLIVVRYVLPSLLCLAGLVVIAIDPHGSTLHGGLGIIGAGLAAFLFAFLSKMSIRRATAPQIAPAEANSRKGL